MPIFTLNDISSLAAVRVTKHFAIFQSKRYQNNKSNLEKGQKRAKRSSENFGTNKCYLGPNFWNLAQKVQPGKPFANFPLLHV